MKTFVLVHGGWHGGWCWTRVARSLRRKGDEVFTPTLTGLGERAHLITHGVTLQTGIDDVLGVLDAEELDDVVLLGHSAGAAVVLGVADRAPDRIASLVLLDGLLLGNGESLRTHFTPAQEDAFQSASAAGAISFPPPPAEAFAIAEISDVAWVNRRLTPQPFGTAASPLDLIHPLANGRPCAYIACVSPVHPFVEASHRSAQTRPDWQWREVESGHDAMITAPELVVRALESLF